MLNESSVYIFVFCFYAAYSEAPAVLPRVPKIRFSGSKCLNQSGCCNLFWAPLYGRLSYFGLWALINNVVISSIVRTSLRAFLIIPSGMAEMRDVGVGTLSGLAPCPLGGTCGCAAQIPLRRALWLVPWVMTGAPVAAQTVRAPSLISAGPRAGALSLARCPHQDPPPASVF